MRLVWDAESGVWLAYNSAGDYLGLVGQESLTGSWYASAWDRPWGRHIFTGGWHKSRDLAALALPGVSVMAGVSVGDV